jgi:hypothetical protein
MGLDQTLSAVYFSNNDEEIAKLLAATGLPVRGGIIDPAAAPNYVSVTVPIFHWRKSNQIHAWFVMNCQDGVDDCRNAPVSRDNLKELVDCINEVLDNPDKAEKLMPTASGFFFGGIEYNEWYFRDLKETLPQLLAILGEPKYLETTFEYSSSW